MLARVGFDLPGYLPQRDGPGYTSNTFLYEDSVWGKFARERNNIP